MSSSKIILLVVAVGLLGVGGYMWSQNKTEKVEIVDTDAQVPSGKKMAFSQFVKQGGSYKCTVNQYVGDTTTEGTTYINEGMIRGEYNTKVQGIDVSTSFIARDGYTYTWSSMAPTMGFKSKIVESTTEGDTTGTSGTYSFNAEQIGDYNCQPWSADSALFVVPSKVTFKTI